MNQDFKHPEPLHTPQKATEVPSKKSHNFTLEKVQLAPDQHDFPLLYQVSTRPANHYKGIITLHGREGETARFRVFKDADLQIKPRYQGFVHESRNDDDRDTTPTQLQRAIDHTIQDIREGIQENNGKAVRHYSQTDYSESVSTHCSGNGSRRNLTGSQF